MSRLSDSTSEPRRRRFDDPEPDRGLQDKRVERAGPKHDYGMRWSCTRVLGISKHTRNVCLISLTRSPEAYTRASFYQEYRAKTLTEKYGSLNTQMDKIIHNANTEIMSLQNKLTGWFDTLSYSRIN